MAAPVAGHHRSGENDIIPTCYGQSDQVVVEQRSSVGATPLRKLQRRVESAASLASA